MLQQPIIAEAQAEPGTETRVLLETQLASLKAAIRPYSGYCALNRAKRMIADIEARLRRPNVALHMMRGVYGENGWAPAVRDIERDLLRRPMVRGQGL